MGAKSSAQAKKPAAANKRSGPFAVCTREPPLVSVSLDDEDIAFPHAMKIAIVGPAKSGKTAMSTRFAFDELKLNYSATIGTEFASVRCSINRVGIALQCWDTAGLSRTRGARLDSLCSQERNAIRQFAMHTVSSKTDCCRSSRNASAVRGVGAVVLTFDGSDPESFRLLLTRDSVDMRSRVSDSTRIYLVACKCDLEEKVSESDALALLRSLGVEEPNGRFFRTSALSNTGIDELMFTLLRDYEHPKARRVLCSRSQLPLVHCLAASCA